MFKKDVMTASDSVSTLSVSVFMGSAPEAMRGKFAIYMKTQSAAMNHGVGLDAMTKEDVISLRDNLSKVIESI